MFSWEYYVVFKCNKNLSSQSVAFTKIMKRNALLLLLVASGIRSLQLKNSVNPIFYSPLLKIYWKLSNYNYNLIILWVINSNIGSSSSDSRRDTACLPQESRLTWVILELDITNIFYEKHNRFYVWIHLLSIIILLYSNSVKQLHWISNTSSCISDARYINHIV